MDVQNKTAIITGSGSGLGRAIALTLAKAGMKIVTCGRRQDKLDETVALIKEAGGTAMAVQTDVTQKAQVEQLVERTLAEFGQIDVLFNNAGRFQAVGGVWEVDVDNWWKDIEVNVRGVMLCAHVVLPHMIERGRGIIINMSGGGAVAPMTGGSGYGTSKAALLRFTDSLAKEMEAIDSGVLVFAMDPGFNPTEMTHGIASNTAADTWFSHIQRRIETGEGYRPEDCAQATLTLLQEATPKLNGRVFYTGDDISAFIQQADQVVEADAHALRLKRWSTQ